MKQKAPTAGSTLLRSAGLAVAGVAGIHLASALTVDRHLQYKELHYRSPRVSPLLEGYTIAFLTDIHSYPEPKLRDMVEELNRRQPDLVLFGGDFSRQRNLSRVFSLLGEVDPTDGFYGVAGNHDAPFQLRRLMEPRGMTFLHNRGALVREGLYVAGVADLKKGRPNVSDALAGCGSSPRPFTLLLSHSPDLTRLQDCSGADLTLCGHTHGGEITLFGLWAPAAFHVTRYGQQLVSGWGKSAAGTDVYVSNGIGQRFPLRSFARPQVILCTLHAPVAHNRANRHAGPMRRHRHR